MTDLPLPGFGPCNECERLSKQVAELTERNVKNQRELARWRGDYGNLYGGSPPAVKGSPTSQEGAAMIAPTAGRLRQQILELYRDKDRNGLGFTCAEVELFFPNHSHQSVSARIRELVLEGDIEFVPGDTRKNPKSGVSVRIYRAVKG